LILALPYFPFSKQRLLRELIAAVGLLLILYAVFAFSSATPFPGATAAVPVAGRSATPSRR